MVSQKTLSSFQQLSVRHLSQIYFTKNGCYIGEIIIKLSGFFS